MTAFYGKLPAKGDFLSRNLPREFVDTWDNWLQTGMHESREALGEQWLESYLTSPLWRFVLPPGSCGQSAYAGVLMPSMDKVGRYFPMAVLRPLEEQGAPILTALRNAAWFENVEARLLAALDEETLDIDAFDQSIQAFGFIDVVPTTQLDGSAATRTQGGAELDLALCLLEVNGMAVREASAGLSFWWGSGSDMVEPSLLYSSGLPAPRCYTAMLCGSWNNYGWSDGGAVATPVAADPLAQILDDLVD
jgi:type VI secretion system protein ImpM